MSNIHNNSVIQSASSLGSIKASEAQNESNGLGSSGYVCIRNEEKEVKEDIYEDRSDLLTDALVGLATVNSSTLFVNSAIMKKLAAKRSAIKVSKTA